MIKLETNADRVIKTFLAEKGCQEPIRIQLQSKGCCEPSLCLIVDQIRESDLVKEVNGLTFVISPEIYQLVGEVTISYREEPGRRGFVITSLKPVSEWEGFAASNFKF